MQCRIQHSQKSSIQMSVGRFHSSLAERRPLQEYVLNQKVKELEHQQIRLKAELQASKEATQSGYNILLSRFDDLQHQLAQQPSKSARLPHILTVTMTAEYIMHSYSD